jgi:hypothetical protein
MERRTAQHGSSLSKNNSLRIVRAGVYDVGTTERLMVVMVDPVHGGRVWVWRHNDTLEANHERERIDTKLRQAHREISAVTRVSELGRQRDPAPNDRLFDIPPRRLAPSLEGSDAARRLRNPRLTATIRRSTATRTPSGSMPRWTLSTPGSTR